MAQFITAGTWDRLLLRQVSGVSPQGGGAGDERSYEEAAREQAFMEDARERFRISANAEDRRRSEMLDDVKFYCGMQWRESDVAMRTQQGKPVLTINRVPGFVSHVVNNMRQARPEIKVDPEASGADEEIAEIRQGLIRHIASDSRASIAYDTAFECLCINGLGYVRVVDAWDAIDSFDQKLVMEWVKNPFSVYEDPSASQPDWSDGKYKFIVEDISLIEHRRRFGSDKTPASLNEFRSLGDQSPYWLLGDKIRIAEYFHIEEEDDELYELEDGSTAFASTMDPTTIMQLEEAGARHSKRKRPVVMWTLLNGLGILKQRRWKGSFIPVIPFVGNQTHLDGETIITGMVRYAKEAQRMFNYMYSSFVEVCALAPRAPFIAEYSQVEEFMEIWKIANTAPTAVLPYRARSVDGQPIPPPQRNTAEPAIGAFVQGLKLADENMKSVFRIYDASLGQKGPQESGIAINSRKVESDLATYDWIDNFGRGLRFLGIVLDELLQFYYNKPGRIVRILQEDLTRKAVTFNQQVMVQGQPKLYDLSKGRFSVSISTGPAFSTRRQEAAKSMLEATKVFPQIFTVAGPQIIRAMDWPDKDIIADQLEKAMPPALQTPKEGQENQDDPMSLKQTLGQAMQQIQVLSKMLSEATDKNNQQLQKELWETYREQMTQETNLALGQIKAGSQEAQFLSQKIFDEFQRIEARLEPFLMGQAGGGAGSAPNAAPASGSAPTAAPGSPAKPPGLIAAPPPQVPSPQGGGSTPAEVGIGTQ